MTLEEQILEYRKAGMKFTEIGKKVNLSPREVEDILERYLNFLRNSKNKGSKY